MTAHPRSVFKGGVVFVALGVIPSSLIIPSPRPRSGLEVGFVEGGSFGAACSRRLTATERGLDVGFETNADIRERREKGTRTTCVRTSSAGRPRAGLRRGYIIHAPVVIAIPVPIPNPGNIIQHLVEHRPREVEPGGEAGERGGEVGSVCGLLN